MAANPIIKIYCKYNDENDSYKWVATVDDGNEISISEAYAICQEKLDQLADELIAEQNKRNNASYER